MYIEYFLSIFKLVIYWNIHIFNDFLSIFKQLKAKFQSQQKLRYNFVKDLMEFFKFTFWNRKVKKGNSRTIYSCLLPTVRIEMSNTKRFKWFHFLKAARVSTLNYITRPIGVKLQKSVVRYRDDDDDDEMIVMENTFARHTATNRQRDSNEKEIIEKCLPISSEWMSEWGQGWKLEARGWWLLKQPNRTTVDGSYCWCMYTLIYRLSAAV